MKFYLHKKECQQHFYDIAGEIEYTYFFYAYEPFGVAVERFIGKTREAILLIFRNQAIRKDYDDISDEIYLNISLLDSTLICIIQASTGLCVDALLYKRSEEAYLNLVGDFLFPN